MPSGGSAELVQTRAEMITDAIIENMATDTIIMQHLS